MQPLSYQSAEASCWTTCMINGIRLVTGWDRVPTRAYRAIQCLLRDDGVHFWTEEEKSESLKNTIQKIQKVIKLPRVKIHFHEGDAVQRVLLELQFDRRVAICGVGGGNHTILLRNRVGNWFEGFDPYWYDEERCGGRLLSFPKGDCAINLKVHQNHLFSQKVNDEAYKKGMAYPMGKTKERFLFVIERTE